MTVEKQKIYLETTMFNFYYEAREYGEYPKYKAQVRELFERIKAGQYEPYTSIFTLIEIEKTSDRVRYARMLALVDEYGVKVLNTSDEAKRLAALYVMEEVISPAYETDILHIAITTAEGLDFIVSLNFTHIARPWTVERVRRVNKREGYPGIGIYKPMEVLEL
jgi:hypothetical protein